MRIVFFGNASIKNAGIRYRILTFAEMLERDGHQTTVCLPASLPFRERWLERGNKLQKLVYHAQGFLRRLLQLRHVPAADVVFIKGPLVDYGPPIIEYLIRALNPRIVFDIDDALWEPPAHVRSFFVRAIDYGWTRKMAKIARCAIAGNERIADYIRQWNPNVTVVPTCIDIHKHTPKIDYDHEGPVVLGWTGVSDNLGYLEIIAPALQRLAQKHDIVLDIASGKPFQIEGVRVVNHTWKLEEEFDYLRNVDIGLMPLRDTPRARGKCAFKALQYMGCAVPPVISPVGMNADVVEHGVEGYLPNTEDEWYNCLETLILDPTLRQHMGQGARARIEREFAHEAYYPKFEAALEAAAQGSSHNG